MKTHFVMMLSLVVASTSRAQLRYTQEQVIAYAKSIDVQALDLGHGRRASYGGYAREVGARVISENGQFVVDDVRIFNRFPAEGPSHLLSASFTGCDGSHWTD